MGVRFPVNKGRRACKRSELCSRLAEFKLNAARDFTITILFLKKFGFMDLGGVAGTNAQ